MIAERRIHETIARCVGIMVYFHNSQRCEASSRLMTAELQDVGREFLGLGLSENGMECLLLRPIRDEMVARYGHELGPRLSAEFLAAFDSLIVR